MVLTLVVVVASLYCYMIYYELETWKGYIDGFLPLVMVGIVMLVLAGGDVWEKNDIRLVIICSFVCL